MGKSAELNDFVPWTKVAPRGAATVYHVGNLAEDAHEAVGSPSDRTRQRAALNVRTAAWSAYKDGLVTLVQRRMTTSDGAPAFEYIAVRV
jgi:hypothetical protein